MIKMNKKKRFNDEPAVLDGSRLSRPSVFTVRCHLKVRL